MPLFRNVYLHQNLALALTVLLASACSGPTPVAPAGSNPTASAALESQDDDEDSGLGTGTITLNLPPHAALTLPVTFCAGHGTILTIVGNEGETQIDLRVPELPGKRDRASMIERAEAGYRFNGTDQKGAFMELWQSRSMDDVVRDGDTTRLSGKMYGLRSYDNGDGTGSTPQSIDGGADKDFTIEATCSV